MIRWLRYLIIHVLAVIARYPLSPIAVRWYSTENKLHLTRFNWLETIDNDLSGDKGWKEEHLAGNDVLSDWNRTRWLWRNGGNALNYGALGCDFQEYTTQQTYWKRDDGYWIFRKFWQVSSTRQLEVFLGWALYGPQLKRCKFVCTIRLPSIIKQ